MTTHEDAQQISVGTPLEAPARRDLGPREFLLLVSILSATTALGIDLILPAFPNMRAEFGMAADSPRVAWTVTSYFLGLAVGPWLYGPASDRYGRRVPLNAGLTLYAVAAVVGALAPSWPLIVISRFVWGLGAAGPRSLGIAMVRDRYEGEAMARLMSISMAVFLIVPILAPSLGKLLIEFLPWRMVFWVPAGLAVLLMLWCRRLPETLRTDRRQPLTLSAVGRAAREVFSQRRTVGLMVSMVFIFGIMNTYLAGTEVIISDVFGYGTWFPLYFGCIAVLFAIMSLCNARLVGRVGVIRLLRREAVAGIITGLALLIVALVSSGRPNFWVFTVAICLCIPLAQGLAPMSNTLAMAPLPHIAGTASSIMGTTTFAGGALLGSLATGAFDGTVRPFTIFVVGYFVMGAAAVFFATWGSTRSDS